MIITLCIAGCFHIASKGLRLKCRGGGGGRGVKDAQFIKFFLRVRNKVIKDDYKFYNYNKSMMTVLTYFPQIIKIYTNLSIFSAVLKN